MRMMPMLFFALLAANCHAAGDEPPTQLRIEIDGKAYVTTAGSSLDVAIGGRSVKLRVEDLPWRHFAQGGLQFDYPQHFPWEFDRGPPHSWTLDGNDSVIMVFDNTASKQTAEEFAGDIEKTVSQDTRAERSKARLHTDKVGTLTGVASKMKLSNTRFSNEVFAIDKGDASWLLVLQDTLDEAGEHSSEYLEMRKRLSATLEF